MKSRVIGTSRLVSRQSELCCKMERWKDGPAFTFFPVKMEKKGIFPLLDERAVQSVSSFG